MGLIALVGLPGSGKSTVGRLLARRLGLPFFDSDQCIEQRLGCSIRAFFEYEGEERFRDIEQATIDDLTGQPKGVVSTGGGAVLREANRQHLRTRAQVVYLHATPEELFRRLRHDRNRPLLQVADPMQKLHELYQQRHPLYKETAHHVLATGRPSVTRLVHMVAMQLELAGPRLQQPVP